MTTKSIRVAALSVLPITLILTSNSTILAQNLSQLQISFAWVAASNGQVPPGAVVGGKENGSSLYICRTEYKNGVHPGKVVSNNCNFGWGGQEILQPNYEVLTAPRSVKINWIAASNGQVPAGFIVAGYEGGQSLILCRAAYKGGVHPGKVVANNCNFGWGGKEILSPNYQVAVLRDR
ncbi:DUF3421 domain-containing protein [Funiculus sociatus GB2-A5]|uniref:DUF3421 domain-containing protein n=1 Tax=Funiculus sociatus GB2-A5 TaxID=2933946 RepID=A0ABV0JJA4_9CYAN|nr:MULTISPECIES: DUF3421 domain-containing protein [unclassified Trichocoleus]MBD1908675.1 DUF3421 domain-containing protein [Trichocoleus sp. FACHB-832]MBD2063297.1 DUF3421 domain-containing protein [Trichocoleus sp. FACHB-6]